MNDKSTQAANRKPVHLTLDGMVKAFLTLATLLVLLLALTAAYHYVWYRWECETIAVRTAERRYDAVDYKSRRERLYYEAELALYRPGELNVPEGGGE